MKNRYEKTKMRGKNKLGDIREDGAIWDNAWDNKGRWCLSQVCEVCKSSFLVPDYHVRKGHGKFCSVACRGAAIRNKLTVKCDTCGNLFERSQSKTKLAKHGYQFCSRKCKDKAQMLNGIKAIHPTHFGTGNGVYRRKSLRHYGCICSECGYNEDDRMLDVHHVDGNRKNNQLENLKVLCVWCHALETRKNWKKLIRA